MKLKGIKPWIKVVKDDPIKFDRIIRSSFGTAYAELVALALSMAKWHPSRGRGRGRGSCGLCLLCTCRDVPTEDCSSCPLFDMGELCLREGSLWWRWDDADTYAERKVYADMLYKVLLKLYVKEYKRVML